MVQVGIADGQAIRRAGLERLIAGTPGMTVGESVADLDDLSRTYGPGRHDVVIVGVMPRPTVPGTVRKLSAGLPVVVSLADERSWPLSEFVKAGVRGYLTSSSTADSVITALRSVGQGGFYACPELADRFRAALVPRDSTEDAALTTREVETLKLLVRGLTHTQIAGRMGLTVSTVNTYVKRIRVKLRARNRVELTRVAIEMGHVDPRPVPSLV